MTTPSKATPVTFNFISLSVRVITDETGEPWFCAKDVCVILGYTNESQTIADHCRKHGVSKRYLIDNLNRKQHATFINEGNLYRLIVKSKKPEAEKFEQLVMEEILPSIRKTGRYVSVPEQAFETLQPKDMNNIARIIWLIADPMHFKESWSHAVWFRLRTITGCKSPTKYRVDHLSIIVNELKRIYSLSNLYSKALYEAEKQVLKRVLRNN